jgi:hypothetical protein
MKRFFYFSAVTVAPLFALLLVVSTFAQARSVKSIRCGTEMVRLGASTFELIQKCGEPDLKETIEAKEETSERWTYNCGTGRFIKIISMRGGKIWKIEEGVRGSGPARCQ